MFMQGCLQPNAMVPRDHIFLNDKKAEEPEEKLEEIKRPSNAIFFNTNLCGCAAGKPVTLGICASFCSNKTHAEPIFYATVKPSAQVELTELLNLQGWCQTPLETDTQNPGCEVEVQNSSNGFEFPLALEALNGNSFRLNISTLPDNEPLRLTIVEKSSGARSSTIQIRKVGEQITDPIGGSLWLDPVSRYSCVVRVDSTHDDYPGSLFYNHAYRMHFYFINQTRPEPIPPDPRIFCHDIYLPGQGMTDKASYNRLEETPGAFTLWNKEDPRFSDISGKGTEEVHTLIVENLKNQGVTINAQSFKIFFPFAWPGKPELNAEAGNTQSNQPIGYYMTPWIDTTNFKAYCPKEHHYYSNNPMFIAMREIVGMDTEGLYIAKKDSTFVTNAQGETQKVDEDYILIRESQLSNIWFYKENGVHIQPNTENLRSKKIQFYWPGDPSSPFIQKSHQRTYTVMDAFELQLSGANTQDNGQTAGTGNQSAYKPHDRRIGCIPVTNN
jgi:hypothetical protein